MGPYYYQAALAPDGGAYPAPYPGPYPGPHGGHALVGFACYGGAPAPYGAPYMAGHPVISQVALPMAADAGGWVMGAMPRWEPHWGPQSHAVVRIA